MEDLLHNIEDNELRLKPEQEHFSHTERLKRSEIEGLDISLWDELCLTAAEKGAGEITSSHSSLLTDEEFGKQTEEYSALKLTADKLIVFTNTDSLKQQPKRIGLWVGVAAAIVILLTLPSIIADKSVPPVQNGQQTVASSSPAQQQNTNVVAGIKDSSRTAQNTVIDTAPVSSKTQLKQHQQAAKSSGVNTRTEENNKANTISQPTQRQPIQLAGIERASQPVILAYALDAEKPTVDIANRDLIANETDEEDVSLLRTIAQRVGGIAQNTDKPDSPRLLDRLAEKGIVGINRLLNKKTVVVKEYDNTGALTLFAVQSNTINFHKSYE